LILNQLSPIIPDITTATGQVTYKSDRIPIPFFVSEKRTEQYIKDGLIIEHGEETDSDVTVRLNGEGISIPMGEVKQLLLDEDRIIVDISHPRQPERF